MRAIIVSILSAIIISAGCALEPAEKTETASAVSGEELFCAVENRETAEEIAFTYGITLVGYEWGIATFHTEEDPITVIERGKTNKLPELNLNIEKQLIG